MPINGRRVKVERLEVLSCHVRTESIGVGGVKYPLIFYEMSNALVQGLTPLHNSLISIN